MTQPFPPTGPYAPPLSPQPYYVQSMTGDPRKPFKRASILMFALAIVALLFAGCLGLFTQIPFDQLPAESRTKLKELDDQLVAQTGHNLQRLVIASIFQFLVPAVLLIITGIGIRTAKRGWVVASLIVVGLMLLMMGLGIMQSLFHVVRDPSAICGMVILALPTALLVLLLVWLINCYKIAGQRLMTTAWQQQQGYYQYPQQPMQYPQQPGAYPQQQMPYPQQPQYPPSGYGYPTQPQPPQAPLGLGTPPAQEPDEPKKQD